MPNIIMELIEDLVSDNVKWIKNVTVATLADDTFGVFLLEHRMLVGYLRYLEANCSIEFFTSSSINECQTDECIAFYLNDPELLQHIDEYFKKLSGCILTYNEMWDAIGDLRQK